MPSSRRQALLTHWQVPYWFHTQVGAEKKKKGDETVPGQATGQRGATRLARDDANVRFPYITDVYGVSVGGHVVAAMRAHVRDYFQKLWDEGRCPDSWFHGASATIKQEFYAYMYDLHAELSLCAFNYKADRLAILGLPGWLENKRMTADQEEDVEEVHRKKKLKLERKQRNKEDKRDKARDRRQKKKDSKRNKRAQHGALRSCAISGVTDI